VTHDYPTGSKALQSPSSELPRNISLPVQTELRAQSKRQTSPFNWHWLTGVSHVPDIESFSSFERKTPRALLNTPLPPHIGRVVSKYSHRAIDPESVMYKFDYDAPAELYPGRNRKSAKKISYRRFEKAADAIRFAVEELPELLLLGAFIEIDEKRLDYRDIQALYASEQYPLKKPVN
jgi:hypothetical protein